MKPITISDISEALGMAFDRWARTKELDEDTAAKGVERYLEGANVNGYWTQVAIRELFADLGFPLKPTQPLPPARVLVALVEEALEKQKNSRGVNNGN